MNDGEFTQFLDTLRDYARSSIDSYRSCWDSSVPTTFHDGVRHDEGPHADRQLVTELFECLLEFYDDLFAVDSSPYRDQWRAKLRYNPSVRQLLSDMRQHPALAPVTWVAMEQAYVQSTGVIGISRSTLSELRAAHTIGSELFHAYQHMFDSPTDGHPILHEGTDAGVSALAWAHLARRYERPAWRRAAATYRTYILIKGYVTICWMHPHLDLAAVADLGLTDDELPHFITGRLSPYIAQLIPSTVWDIEEITILDLMYRVGGVVILAGRHAFGDAFVAQLFHGEAHPWTDVVDTLTELGLQDPLFRLDHTVRSVVQR